MFSRSALHWFPTLPLFALLLLLGGRLTAYITPGEFLGIGPANDISVSSSSSASVPLPTLIEQQTSSVPLLPTLFGPAAPSSSTAPLLPTLFGQTTSSVSSSYLLPILFGTASSTAPHTTTTTGNGSEGGNGTVGGKTVSSSTTSKGIKISSAKSSYKQFFGQNGTVSSARILVAPAYDAYYARLTTTTGHQAFTPSQTVPALASSNAFIVSSSRSTSSQSVLSSVPASSSSLRSSSAAMLPTAVAVHAGAQPLPASGSPYALALLLVLPAGWMVLRFARQAEL